MGSRSRQSSIKSLKRSYLYYYDILTFCLGSSNDSIAFRIASGITWLSETPDPLLRLPVVAISSAHIPKEYISVSTVASVKS